MKVICKNWEECITPCLHHLPHEIKQYGKYAHHNCHDEKTLQCGSIMTQNGVLQNVFDAQCVEFLED